MPGVTLCSVFVTFGEIIHTCDKNMNALMAAVLFTG